MSFRINGAAPLFQVFDMPVSVSFYRDKLGFKLVDSSGGEVIQTGYYLNVTMWS